MNEAPSHEPTLPRLHVVGDSISIHYGPDLARFVAGVWHYSRKQGPEGDLDNPAGCNGGDSFRVLDYLRECERAGRRWDLLVINCGLHDIKTDPASGRRQVATAEYAENLREIVALGRVLARQVAWVSTTPIDEARSNRPGRAFHRFVRDVDEVNAIAARIMAEAGVPVIDLHGFTRRLGGELYCDHAHFHAPVRALQAAFMAGALERLRPRPAR